MYDVVDYENKYGGIILDSSQVPAAVVTIKGESSRLEVILCYVN